MMWNEEISLPRNYNVPVMLRRLGADPLHNLDEKEERLKIPVAHNGKAEGITLRFYRTEEGYNVNLTGDTVPPDAAAAKAESIFLWNRPLETINEHFHSTDLAPLFERFAGTPLVCEFETYGCLMKTIIHQQLNMSFAYTLSSRFVETYGEMIDDVWFYPEPEHIAGLEPAELKELQFSRSKAEYVIDTSKMIVEGKLDLETLKEKPDEEIMKTLTAIRGVGPWTAQCFLLFGLGRPDLLPAKDIGIQNGLKHLWSREEKPSVQEIQEKSKEWSPYASYAALYIWLSTEFN
ncbi:DNA-3-methyladenine glycosylase family protein [Salibacterium lacus]|uniref:DNA-3-methyladenine glycosylase II n=1 Tax=Salibacterium lacus TaxID=1898109 RepID=A0ABW5SZ29_9BACI